jgi:hypothetical protein
MSRLLLAALVVCALSSSVLAQGTISDGNATFTYNSGTTPGSANFRPEGGTSTDHFFQDWWWWRVNGVSTAENRMQWVPSSQSYVGNTAMLGHSQALFDWDLTVVLDDGGAAGQAGVVQTMELTNTSASPISLSIFHYLDVDVQATTTDSATINAGLDRMTITDTSGSFVEFYSPGADRYQATSFSTLRTALDNATIGDLTNTGLPFGPGDFTGAFQWDGTIAAGESVTLYSGVAINQTAIPEPATLGLLALGGLMIRRRRA